MNRCGIFKFLSIFLLLLILYSYAWPQGSLAPLVKRIQPAIVTILTYNYLGERMSIGSGFFINKDGLLISNYHVIKGAMKIEVQTPDKNIYQIKGIVAEDKNADLVVLLVDIPRSKLKYLKITNYISEVGDRVMVIGSPFGLEQTISDGVVSAIRDISGFGEILQISAPISPGSSGGPVINMRGEVIGVATFQIVGGQNLNFAIPAFRVSIIKDRSEQYLSKSENKSAPKSSNESDRINIEGQKLTHDIERKYYAQGSASLIQAKIAEQTNFYKNAEEKYKEAISFFERAILIEPYSEARIELQKAKISLDNLQKRYRRTSPDSWKDELRKKYQQ